jgi:hypothetical protein
MNEYLKMFLVIKVVFIHDEARGFEFMTIVLRYR